MVKLVNGVAAAINLNDLVIDTPCPMEWERMDGDERKRFCSRCEKHVYNISEMTEHEALQLVGNGDHSVCARIFRRPDGTIVTSQCPRPGKKTTGRRFQFSIATLVTLLTSSAALFASAPWISKQIEPLVQNWLGQTSAPPPGGNVCVLGGLAAPIPAVPPAAIPAPLGKLAMQPGDQ